MKTTLEFIAKLGLTIAIAAALLVPSSMKVQGGAATDAGLTSPPIVQINAIPWIAVEPRPQTFKIDTLLAPQYEQPQRALASAYITENGSARTRS